MRRGRQRTSGHAGGAAGRGPPNGARGTRSPLVRRCWHAMAGAPPRDPRRARCREATAPAKPGPRSRRPRGGGGVMAGTKKPRHRRPPKWADAVPPRRLQGRALAPRFGRPPPPPQIRFRFIASAVVPSPRPPSPTPKRGPWRPRPPRERRRQRAPPPGPSIAIAAGRVPRRCAPPRRRPLPRQRCLHGSLPPPTGGARGRGTRGG